MFWSGEKRISKDIQENWPAGNRRRFYGNRILSLRRHDKSRGRNIWLNDARSWQNYVKNSCYERIPRRAIAEVNGEERNLCSRSLYVRLGRRSRQGVQRYQRSN